MSPPTSRFLIPVSERKQLGGNIGDDFGSSQQTRAHNRFASLTEPRRRVLGVFLSAVNGQGHAAEVLRLEGEPLEDAVNLNLAITRGPVLRVRERFQGPLFKQIDSACADPLVERRLRERVIVFCPLLGLLGLNDHVPAYRCPVGAQIPGFGSLHEFWKPRISPVLNRVCRNQVVYSFLSSRVEALWPQRPAGVDFVRVHFTRRRGAKLMHEHAGARREAGRLIRHMAEQDLRDPEQILDWESGVGHVFSPEHSELEGSERRLVFVR